MEEQTAENLNNILKSKQQLLKSALQSENEIRLNGNMFSSFHAVLDADRVLAYLSLTAKLCDLAKTLRYVSPVERTVENQKYAFRCFLLRLVFIGKNYKTERKILLAPLEGNNNQYLWQPSVTAGTPDTILNRPIVTSAYVPTIAAGNKTIAFGDFDYYWIADRQGRSFKRLNELFAATGQVGFMATERVDGKLILPEAIKILQQKST